MGGVRPFLLGKPCDENPQYNRFWDGYVMRARNIKPGFFKNEDLCDLEPIDRLLFAGLWLLADREGRLEDRPKRIRLELFPLDNYDVNQGLDRLHAAGFISRYVIETQAIVQISNFDKHQSPHGTEKDSELPDENGFLTVHERGKSGQVTGAKRLINVKEREAIVNKRPDSLNPDSLNPDSLNPDSLNPELAPTPLKHQAKPGADKSPGKTSLSKSDLIARGVDEQVAIDFLELRKRKKAPLTNTAFQGLQREAEKAGVSISEALATCAARGWTGLNAEWLTKQAPAQTTTAPAYRPYNPNR